MNTSPVCAICRSAIVPDAPEGLCPECLLKAGFETKGQGGDPAFRPPDVEQLTKLFPQLEIIELVGQGGMAAVYKAKQPALDRYVALKILRPQTTEDPSFAERFSREARALARLNHPNIVAVYDFGRAGDLPYLVMEYVGGSTLRQVVRAGKLSPRETLDIVVQICEALQFAHDQGVVHRDIKPENILLDQSGRVKIADFGIAKVLHPAAHDLSLTGAKEVVGTAHYMAPEQFERPQTVDHRADIFSLGVVFYELLTGELPLGKFAPPSQKRSADVRLDPVVLRALEKEPERRYQQANEVKTRVEAIAREPAPGATVAAERGGRGIEQQNAAELDDGVHVVYPGASHRRGIYVLAYAAAALLVAIGLGIGLFVLGKTMRTRHSPGRVANALASLVGSPPSHESPALAPGTVVDASKALVRVSVYDLATGSAIAGARVADIFLNRGPERAVRDFQTDSAGQVELRTWNEANHSLNVSAPGYQAADRAYPVEPPGSQKTVQMVFRLQGTNWVSALTNSWSPSVEPADAAEAKAILEKARALSNQGEYEEAFQRYLWYHSHAMEYGVKSYERQFALTEWSQLSRRYPKARQALFELRERASSELLSDGGYLELFTEVAALNRQLQDEDATCSLFKAIRQKDPDLAQQCFPSAESLLVKQGEYDLCLACLGDYQAAFDSFRKNWERRKQTEERMADMQEQNRRRLAEAMAKSPYTNSLARLGSSPTLPLMPRTADNFFVSQTCELVEILLGTGHKAEAVKVRDQAVALVDDSWLKSAIPDAEERVRKNRASPQPVPAKAALGPSAISAPAPVRANNAGPAASAELWTPPGLQKKPVSRTSAASPRPSATPGAGAIDPATGLPISGAGGSGVVINPLTGLPVPAPPGSPEAAETSVSRLPEEAHELIQKHRYEDALQRLIWYQNHAREFTEVTPGFWLKVVLPDWLELGRRYPKAKQALLEIRDNKAREFELGHGQEELFEDLAAVNESLQDEEATYSVFNALQTQNPALAAACYRVMQPLLLKRGEYEVCLRYLGEPRDAFENYRRSWEVTKATSARHEETMKEPRRWQAEFVRKWAADHPDPPMHLTLEPPGTDRSKEADDHFVSQVSTLVLVLVGVHRQSEAEHVSKQALAVLDDPRLETAVSDAQQRIASAAGQPPQTSSR